ncbi:MAG TPA: MFS transporter [Terriglobales bacterium]|jgi:SHS family lactate transporter-like MFS transporter|nr:MFS transporter [Terriglobales bacterium]
MSSATMPGPVPLSRSDQWHAVTASFLGWTLDAFDFFVLVFLFDTLSVQFHVSKEKIIFTTFATLAMRPVGAVVFGLLADRYGRRKPLMANVVFFSIIELFCGFAPNYTVFLILRTLYGIGMGGEWGVGASLAMESAPGKWRGILSGIVQSGYSIGYLLAAVAARVILPLSPAWGWRAMFWVGGIPALLAFYIRFKVRESEAWKQHRAPTLSAILKTASGHWKIFFYLVLLMTLMMFLSHGTQDLYPDFLKSARGFAPAIVSYMAILYNIGAVLGAIAFGHISEKIGRRRSMIAALILSLAMIPAWAFGGSLAMLALGAFMMQVGVQGAWGIIPAHLNELAPDAVRGLMPGFAYQLGILFAAPTNTLEYALRDHLGYAWALAAFEITNIAFLITVVALGAEKKGKSFVQREVEETA